MFRVKKKCYPKQKKMLPSTLNMDLGKKNAGMESVGLKKQKKSGWKNDNTHCVGKRGAVDVSGAGGGKTKR